LSKLQYIQMVSEMVREGNSRIRGRSILLHKLLIYRPHAVIKSPSMRIRLYSNGIEAPLTSFIGKFLGNVCAGITASLKTPQPVKGFRYELEGEMVRIYVNQIFVPLDMSQGFSRIIVQDTIRGMIHHLKLADPAGVIKIEVDMEAESG
jgi:hypothetical protein